MTNQHRWALLGVVLMALAKWSSDLMEAQRLARIVRTLEPQAHAWRDTHAELLALAARYGETVAPPSWLPISPEIMQRGTERAAREWVRRGTPDALTVGGAIALASLDAIPASGSTNQGETNE